MFARYKINKMDDNTPLIFIPLTWNDANHPPDIWNSGEVALHFCIFSQPQALKLIIPELLWDSSTLRWLIFQNQHRNIIRSNRSCFAMLGATDIYFMFNELYSVQDDSTIFPEIFVDKGNNLGVELHNPLISWVTGTKLVPSWCQSFSPLWIFCSHQRNPACWSEKSFYSF